VLEYSSGKIYTPNFSPNPNSNSYLLASYGHKEMTTSPVLYSLFNILYEKLSINTKSPRVRVRFRVRVSSRVRVMIMIRVNLAHMLTRSFDSQDHTETYAKADLT
jgi:hypothetical protein